MNTNTNTSTTLPKSSITDLLLHLCSGDDELALYVARWIAFPLRNPIQRMQTALIVTGEQGTGKSMFFDVFLSEVYGNKKSTLPPGVFHSPFNEWVTDKRLIVVETNVLAEGMNKAEEAYLTKNTITVNTRGQPPQHIENRTNFIFLSGAVDCNIDLCDRRFIIIKAPATKSNRFYEVGSRNAESEMSGFRQWLTHDLDMSGFTQYSRPHNAANRSAA